MSHQIRWLFICLLDFAGLAKQTLTYHKRLSTDTERTITETFEYDKNRLKVHKHKVDNNTEEILAQNDYNELSQLTSKKVGGPALGTGLQEVNYAYNIRGWMTQINDPANLGTDLFGYKINYNQIQGLPFPNSDFLNLEVQPKFNGNIAEVSWKTLTEENEPLKRYGYVYDGLNRLQAGFYQKAGSENAQEYFEKIDYDLNGNISRLKRSAELTANSPTALLIDNLKYDYAGNRLTKVTEEQIGNSNGYPYVPTPNPITYDDNGNMISHLDKGISSIQYNYLNLPKQIIQDSKVISHTYRADGSKVKKLFGDLETNYLDGFQYKSTFLVESWNGVGTYHPDPNEIPELKLRIIPTAEGYYDALLNQYVYNFTDHLGNVRISYTDTNKDGIIQPRAYNANPCSGWFCFEDWRPGEIVSSNNYYPFGMLHNYTATTQNAYQYKYQGQELQETGFYSFKWRNYMPDVGRFFNIDPLAEKFTYNSPYAFAENRVIDGRELEGLEWVSSRNLENKSVNWHLTYKPVNNAPGVISKEQMVALTRDREAQIASSYGGKDSSGNQVSVTFSQSDKATISWEYNMVYDLKGVEGADKLSENGRSQVFTTTDGLTDKIGDTQNNRSQINVALTNGIEWTDSGYIDWGKSNTATVAATGAHETGHELGLRHTDKETVKNPQSLLRETPKGTQISPAQRTQITNLIEQQQKQE